MHILASSLGFKTFRVVVSVLVFLWRALEVILSLFMVSQDLFLCYCCHLIYLLQTGAAVSSIGRRPLQKLHDSKRSRLQERSSDWNLDPPEGHVPPVSNVRDMQRSDTRDPRITRRLAGPRVSRIPDRICRHVTQDTLHGLYTSSY